MWVVQKSCLRVFEEAESQSYEVMRSVFHGRKCLKAPKVSLLRVAAPSDVTSPVARINNSYEAKMARVCNMHVNQTEQKARWSQELSLSIARVKEQRYSFC